MRKRILLLATAFLAALSTACPYESETPLAEPLADALDVRLTGVWQASDAENGKNTRIVILPFNRSEYLIEAFEEGEEPDRFRAYLVAVGDERLLNVHELKLDEAAEAYWFARYSLSDEGRLALHFVGDKAVPKSVRGNRQELVNFLAAHLKDGSLEDEDGPLELRRAGN